jgi:hypothetical protein
MADSHELTMQQFLDVLPFYVNGSTNAAQQAQIKHKLAGSSEARAALAWHEALAEKVIGDVESVRADVGWAQLRSKVRATRRAHQPAQVLALWSRIESYLPHRWLSAPALSGVCAVLLAVVVGQGLLLTGADAERGYSDVRSMQSGDTGTPAEAAANKYVKINFKDKITERDMRLMLVRAGAKIVSGPGQLGDYVVAVPSAELDLSMKQFKDSLLTESVLETAAPSASTNAGTTGAAPGKPALDTTVKSP